MSNIQEILLSKYEPVEAIEKENRSGWIDYGQNNLFPQHLINLYHNSPIHNALTNSIAFMIEGQGTGTILDNALQGIAFDLKLQGAFCAEIIWSMDFTRVVQINHLPFENCRLAYDRDEDDITGIFYSKDWANTRSKKGKPEFIPAFNPSLAQEQPRQVIYAHGMSAGSVYYPKPDYFGALNYIELSYQMGLYHVNNILNGLFPSFIINFLNGIPQKEEREAIRREWETRLSGANNAGKFLMTFNEDPTRAPQIEAFPLSDADKQYQFLSEETAKQIMVGHRVVSPLIHGIRDTTGFGSNKDEMLVGLEIFNNQVIKPYQRIIERVFTPILGDVNIEMNSPFDEVVVEPTTQTIELKKKVVAQKKDAVVKISKEEGEAWLAHLREKAEYINEEEWQLLSDEEVTNPEDEEKFRSEFMSVRGYAKPDEKSEEKDTGFRRVPRGHESRDPWRHGGARRARTGSERGQREGARRGSELYGDDGEDRRHRGFGLDGRFVQGDDEKDRDEDGRNHPDLRSDAPDQRQRSLDASPRPCRHVDDHPSRRHYEDDAGTSRVFRQGRGIADEGRPEPEPEGSGGTRRADLSQRRRPGSGLRVSSIGQRDARRGDRRCRHGAALATGLRQIHNDGI